MKLDIRLLYLYLFSFVGLLIAVIGTVRLVDLGLKVLVFKGADQYYMGARPIFEEKSGETISEEDWQNQQEEESKRQRQRELSGAVSMVVVGFPLYLYHWSTIDKERKTKK